MKNISDINKKLIGILAVLLLGLVVFLQTTILLALGLFIAFVAFTTVSDRLMDALYGFVDEE